MHNKALPLVTVLLSCAAAAQAPPAPGFRVFADLGQTDVRLIDTNNEFVHAWPGSYEPGAAVYVREDGKLLRTIRTNAQPPIAGGEGGGVQLLDFYGNVEWEYRYDGPGVLSHHDIIAMPGGNVMLTAYEEKTIAETLQAGRKPELLGGTVFRPDHLVEVRPTGPTSGEIVWRWHLWDHLVQDLSPHLDNWGPVAQRPGRVDINHPPVLVENGDYAHINGIDYDPVHDWIVMSAPFHNEVWIIDHGTTTAEAATGSGGRWGKGGDLLWRWGNPAAYRRGTAADQQLGFQHDPRFVPPGHPGAGNLTVFNNRYQPLVGSAVFELQLPLDPTGAFVPAPGNRPYGPAAPVWTFAAPGFYSPFVSSAQRLPNGHTLVCSGGQRTMFEVDPGGDVVWFYQHTGTQAPLFHAHYVDRTLWSSGATVSAAAGGSVALELVSGSRNGGRIYLMLGSTLGTAPGISFGGVHIPLNPDFLFDYLATNHEPAIVFSNTIDDLDPLGNGTTNIDVPPALLPPQLAGLQLHFAYVVADAALQLHMASNPVALTIVP